MEVLELFGGGISDITPLAEFTGLRKLALIGAESDYFAGSIGDLAGLAGLTGLYLRKNEIRDTSSVEWVEYLYAPEPQPELPAEEGLPAG